LHARATPHNGGRFPPKIEQLAKALEHDDAEQRDIARQTLRGFIDRIVIPPGDGLLQVAGNWARCWQQPAGVTSQRWLLSLMRRHGFRRCDGRFQFNPALVDPTKFIFPCLVAEPFNHVLPTEFTRRWFFILPMFPTDENP
jgi:hypothetical protein